MDYLKNKVSLLVLIAIGLMEIIFGIGLFNFYVDNVPTYRVFKIQWDYTIKQTPFKFWKF